MSPIRAPGQHVPRRPRLIVGLLVLVMIGVTGLAWWVRLWQGHRPPTLRITAASSRAAVVFPDVRVCLGNPTLKSFSLEIRGSYQMLPIGGTQLIRSGESLDVTNVTTTATGLQIGEDVIPITRLEIRPESSRFFWVNDHAYRGKLMIYRQPNGTLLAVNHVPMRDYLASVVDSEMPASFGPEARRSQVIAARTYALWQMQSAPREALYDLFSSTRSQKYLGYQYRTANGRLLAGESPEGRGFVNETAGMVCVEDSRLFCTYYSAVCGGDTMTGTEIFSDAAPCLRTVSCHFCEAASRYRWEVDLDRTEVAHKLSAYFRAKGLPFQTLRSIENEPLLTGALPRFLISDGTILHRLDATELRNVLGTSGMFSQHFLVELTTDRLKIQGQGHGHGVGFCQWGARGQGLAGKNGIEILSHYYPGSRVVRLVP